MCDGKNDKDDKNEKNKKDKKNRRNIGLLKISIGLLIVFVSLYLSYTYSDEIRSMGKWGYIGVLIVSFLSAATIFIPAPSLLVVGSLASVRNPFVLSLFAGIGAGLGEFTGYISGEGLSDIESESMKDVLQYKKLILKYGPTVVFVFALIPNPLFDIVGVASGILRMNRKTFLLAVVLGNILKYLIVCFSFNLIYTRFGLVP